jgi:hypothetical protein
MSKTERWQFIIGTAGVVLMAIPAWDVLDKRNLVTASILIGSWCCGAGMLIYSTFRMLRDIGRATRVSAILESERRIHTETDATLQAELRKRQESLEHEATRHQAAIAALTKDHADEIKALRYTHAKNIKDARRIVIRSAWWGLGGPYNSDQTAMLQLLLDRDAENLRASTEFFPDNYPGDAKRLAVEYFSPFSSKIERRTFQEGDEIDFAKIHLSSQTHP